MKRGQDLPGTTSILPDPIYFAPSFCQLGFFVEDRCQLVARNSSRCLSMNLCNDIRLDLSFIGSFLLLLFNVHSLVLAKDSNEPLLALTLWWLTSYLCCRPSAIVSSVQLRTYFTKKNNKRFWIQYQNSFQSFYCLIRFNFVIFEKLKSERPSLSTAGLLRSTVKRSFWCKNVGQHFIGATWHRKCQNKFHQIQCFVEIVKFANINFGIGCSQITLGSS